MAKTKLKPVIITDQEALKVVYDRAEREHRNFSNAAAVSIIESSRQGKRSNRNSQANFRDEIIEK